MKHPGFSTYPVLQRGKLPSRSSFSSRNKFPTTIQQYPTPIRVFPNNKIPAILATRQHGGIGDLLMCTPSFRVIKEQNPNIPLIVSTTERYGTSGVLFDILKHNPYVDKVVRVQELIKYNFSKIYNFGTGREVEIEVKTNKNRIDIFAELAGLELTDKQTIYVVTDTEKQKAQEWIEKEIPSDRRRLIGIQMHSTHNKRDWGDEKTLLLAFQIVNKWNDTSVLIFDDGLISRKKIEYPNIYKIIGVPIRQVAALINECEAFVAPDSGLLHIAGALKKKIFGLFGSTPPQARISYYDNAEAIFLYLPCSACWYSSCALNYECMAKITTNQVLRRIERFLYPSKKILEDRILVIRMGGVGDLACLSSSLKTFRKENKGIIHLATKTENVPLLKGVNFLDDVYPIEQIAEKGIYDRVIDLRYGVEPPNIGQGKMDWDQYISQDRSDLFDRLMGVKSEKEFEVFVDPEVLKTMKKKLSGLKGKIIAINPTTKGPVRPIPVEYIQPLIKMILKELNASVVLFGQSQNWGEYITSRALKQNPRILNLFDKTSLQEAVALIKLSDVLIAPDAGAMHLAGVLKTKCLAIFGNIDPETRIKYYPTVKALYPKGELPCVPCWDVPELADYCRNGTNLGWLVGERKTRLLQEAKKLNIIPRVQSTVGNECIKLITPERIFEALKEIL